MNKEKNKEDITHTEVNQTERITREILKKKKKWKKAK